MTSIIGTDFGIESKRINFIIILLFKWCIDTVKAVKNLSLQVWRKILDKYEV
ncbi:hypothetical protein HYE44_03070 [Mycoplasmopsis bovis]|nr:hypothetical protein HYE44_03070 [Mycoplasmopsis bovis]